MGLVQRLRALGICGINRRNALLIFPRNPRKFYPTVDNKLLTKEIATRFHVPVPELYGMIRIYHELKELGQVLAPYPRFVIKPARGAQGKGILLVTGRANGYYLQTGGRQLTLRELEYYVSGILSGLHSLGGQVDEALIESMIEADPVFQSISYGGVPDIRVVVYRGAPVMSMVRLPTQESRGKANLHQGAVGMGVNILTGVSTYAVHKNRPLERHPDTGQALAGVTIPFWEQILTMAAHALEMTGLGYVGVDIVLDKNKGPLLLELNARPGLNIQIANRAGLLPRVAALDRIDLEKKNPAERVVLAREALA
jgi:alpha-L-glutamate ligase-like protein